MSQSCLLAGDIGGTKTVLQLVEVTGLKERIKKSYESIKFNKLEDIINVFLEEAKLSANTIQSACFAIAGPVTGAHARLTNLKWEVDANAIARRFNFSQVILLNDFEAVGFGIEALAGDALTPLQQGQPVEHGTKLVIGAGTGLGVAHLMWREGRYRVYPSEGGHADFAPLGAIQVQLSAHLQSIHGHVSYERVVSGPGLVAIFRFLCAVRPEQMSAEILPALEAGDPAAVIATFALTSRDAVASLALETFVDIYGAFAGNLALITLARGGVYIAGGIAAKILPALRNGRFTTAFSAKGRFNGLLSNIPLYVVTHPNAGLLGAMMTASRA